MVNFIKLPARNKKPNWLLNRSLKRYSKPKTPITKAVFTMYESIILLSNKGKSKKLSTNKCIPKIHAKTTDVLIAKLKKGLLI